MFTYIISDTIRLVNSKQLIRRGESIIKTNEHNVSFNDLTVDTAGLQALTHAGIKTATEIGVAAGAKIYVGRRVLWNVAKIRKYLDEISE